jgi:hypothetical protein
MFPSITASFSTEGNWRMKDELQKKNSTMQGVIMKTMYNIPTFVRAFTILVVLSSALCVSAQKQLQDVYVDDKGVMRWGENNEEVRAFGINYTAMFAHAFRMAKKSGISIEKAIDDDVYHFARLGFDAFRVHVWDTEISDTSGNLLSNEHLRLFDYALSKMKDRGMKFVITPIAYWGNGWPERDGLTPGFSRKYGKDESLTNRGAIKAQERYLFQFLNHVNEYTGIAYKTDPAIIAFEVSNEPHHNEAPEKVTAFINRMVQSMRKTGCKKPIFYNVSHSIHLADAYFNSDIQGGTFQWYPTGLVAGRELRGNFLPNVDQYNIPFGNNPKFKRMAKIVYEFDAADVGRSYIYPAMARSFREAGMQLATHFSYDPTYIADVNTEYATHYMNLAYAPQKALSLMIASEVFQEIPLYQSYGKYPANTTFGSFRVSYEDDLAEMVTDKKFLYTNNTASVPPAPEMLEKIAGFGNSAIIKYEGSGAYFLDRIEDGVWRLEVMPDAIWVADPFGKTSPKKQVAAIHWRKWPMSVDLPELGNAFAIAGINAGNSLAARARDKSFLISPGTYVLMKDGLNIVSPPTSTWKNIVLNEFVAPKPSLHTLYVRHDPGNALPGNTYTVDALIAAPDSLVSVQLFAWGDGFRPEVFRMEKINGYHYRSQIPGDKVKEGILNYYIVVKQKDKSYTYPSGSQTHPHDWDFFGADPYSAAVIPATSPVLLFNASTDADKLLRQWIPNSSLKPSWRPGIAELEINVEKLFISAPGDRKPDEIYDYSMRYFIGNKMDGRSESLKNKRKIVFTGRSLNGKPCKFQIALVSENGAAFGGIITVHPEKSKYELALADLKQVKLVTLPRPYPTFLSYYFDTDESMEFDITAVEALQLSIGPGIAEKEADQPHGIAIESITLE